MGIKQYRWTVPTTEVVKSFQLFTFTYDSTVTVSNASTPAVAFFINESAYNNASSSPKQPVVESIQVEDDFEQPSSIKLGISPITINPGAVFNANLYAYMMYSTILTSTGSASDLKTLKNYFEAKRTGYNLSLIHI